MNLWKNFYRLRIWNWFMRLPLRVNFIEVYISIFDEVFYKYKIMYEEDIIRLINLNYSRNSIWTDNCTMNLKIDPCSYNITQLTCQKGIKSLWHSSEQLLNCQGSLIVAIPAVHSACRYLKVSHRIHSYKGSCYTVWMWYILLNELLLQQSSAVLNGQYQCVVFACLLITPIV